MKSVSRFAILAAAGVLISGFATAPANAADLGGDCCADLDERVSELEATTVRKGNKKVSVKIYGNVNKAVLFWDDGDETNAYVVDNDNKSTRFGLTGKAKIRDNWSAGYKIEIEVDGGHSTAELDQINDNHSTSPSVRKSVLYIKNKMYGKVSLGLEGMATDDITHKGFVSKNTNAIRPDFHYNRDFFLRPKGSKTLAGEQFGSLCGDSFDPDACFDSTGRRNVVRYDSPTFAGFSMSVAWGEDDAWDIVGRWGGKAGDFKAKIIGGYRNTTDEGNEVGGGGLQGFRTEEDMWALSGGVMHTPTGLYVQGTYKEVDIDLDPAGAVGFTDGTDLPESQAWYIQAGIQKRFLPIGKTNIYGEYAHVEDGFIGECFSEARGSEAGVADFDVCDNDGDYGFAFAGSQQIVSSELRRWGVGIVQDINPAAMQLYVLYQHIEAEATFEGGLKGDFEDFDLVVTGAYIQF